MKKFSLSIFTLSLALILCISLSSTLSYADTSGLQRSVKTSTLTPLYKDATKKVIYTYIQGGMTLSTKAYHRVNSNWWCKVTYGKYTGWIESKNVSNSPFLKYKNATYKTVHSKGSNVRQVASTSNQPVTRIPQNTTLKFSEFKTIGGYLWGKISSSSQQNKKCKGRWVCIREHASNYIDFVGSFKTTKSTVIRKTPYQTGKVVASYPKNTKFKIDRIELNNKSNWWGRIDSTNSKLDNCWIYLGNLKPN